MDEKTWNPIKAMGIGDPKLYDEMLNIWSQIQALDENKAKLALFGLTIQNLHRPAEFSDESFCTFYLIDLKKQGEKLFWRWTGQPREQWSEVTDIHSFLTTYYPPEWCSYIIKTMDLVP